MTIQPASPRPPAPAREVSQAEPAPLLPDLAVDKIQPDTYFPFPGEDIWFDAKVANHGMADSPAFDVELTGSGNPGSTTVRVEGLKAGESVQVRIGPMEFYWGEFNFAQVTADSGREVAESNEKNNRRSVSLTGPQRPQPPQPPIPPIPIPPRPPRP